MTPARRTFATFLRQALTAAVAFLLVGAPLAGFLVEAWERPAAGDLAATLLPDGRLLLLFARSVALAAATAAAAAFVALFAARLLWRRFGASHPYLAWLPISVIAVPSYLHGLAWQQLGRSMNTALGGVAEVSLDVPGEVAAWWTQMAALLPVAFAFAMFGYAFSDRTLREAGRIFGSEARRFLRIELPLVAPFIIAGAIVVFILTLLDHGVAALFLIRSYPLEAFAIQYQTGNPLDAFAVSLPIMLLAFAAFAILALCLRHLELSPESIRRPRRDFERPGPAMTIAELFCLLLLAAHIVILLGMLLLAPLLSGAVFAVLPRAGEPLLATIAVATAAAFLAGIAGLVITPAVGRTWQVFWICLPLAIPPALAATGGIFFWNLPGLDPVYDSLMMPALICAFRFAPIAIMIAAVYRSTTDPALFDAAKLFRLNPAAEFLRVRLPLMARGFGAAILVVFSFAAGELPATLLTTPPGSQTLVVRAFTLLHYGASDQVLGIAAILIAVPIGAIIAAILLISLSHRAERKTA